MFMMFDELTFQRIISLARVVLCGRTTDKNIDSISHLIRRTLIEDFKTRNSTRNFSFVLLRDLFLNASEQEIDFR